MDYLFEIFGWIAALLTSTGFIPQVIKGLKSKKVDDISILTIIVFGLGTFLWMLYGFYREDIIIICANILVCTCTIVLLFLKMAYKKTKNA